MADNGEQKLYIEPKSLEKLTDFISLLQEPKRTLPIIDDGFKANELSKNSTLPIKEIETVLHTYKKIEGILAHYETSKYNELKEFIDSVEIIE